MSSSRAVISKPESALLKPEKKENAVDFIGPSHAVKSLFSVPYATDRPISVAVHNLDGTLLVDAVEEDDIAQRRGRRRPRPASFDCANNCSPNAEDGEPTSTNQKGNDALALITSMLNDASLSSNKQGKLLFNNKNRHTDESNYDEEENKVSSGPSNHRRFEENNHHQMMNLLQSASPNATGGDLSSVLPTPEQYVTIPLPSQPRDYVCWDFQSDLRLLIGSDALVYQDRLAVRVADVKEMQSLLQESRQVPTKPSYAQAVGGSRKGPLGFSAHELNQVQVQTSIVPSPPQSGILSEAPITSSTSAISTKPVCTVLDVYLDNIMTNVPQLAVCLREKGFIQSIKLLDTQDIPSSYLQSSEQTSDDSSFSICQVDTTAAGDPLFSPQVMEMNASSLLRFLKSNCTRDNATYLLRREAGETKIQLYDMAAISAQGQHRWIWWLASMSYRFALRLGQLDASAKESPARRRAFRSRQRSLLQNALSLLEDLQDRGGGNAHETLCATICEHLADTFLSEDNHIEEDSIAKTTLSSPPYARVMADALGKAQDHLKAGIKKLRPLWEQTQHKLRKRQQKKRRKKVVKVQDENSSSSSDDDEEDNDGVTSPELDAITLQLFGIHHKLINVSLRLVEHFLHNYYSSSAMQNLRTSARAITDAIPLASTAPLRLSLKYQFIWLWEHCGHFARSFAADPLWRERGHACGDDILGVLRDVEQAVTVLSDHYNPNDWFNFVLEDAPITDATGGLVSLDEVGSIVEKDCATTILEVQSATRVLDRHKVIKRDERRVLVAACVSYSRAIGIFEEIIESNNSEPDCDKAATSSDEFLSLLKQRLGDSCNEIGKILLAELRQMMSTKDGSVAEIMLHSAQFWFEQGLQAFESCSDLRNIALLRCNLCQCWKLRANSIFSSEGHQVHAEECLQAAVDHLQEAHQALGERHVDPLTWDSVSQELAATFLVLGVRRRQSVLGGGGMTPVITLRLSPGQERRVIEPMEKALSIYEASNNAHQAAATHYQLALFYARVWTSQRDESKTREKLSSAFTHYAAAHAYFAKAPHGNESTFVVLCLDLANLYSAVSGEECLSKALCRCLDTAESFAASGDAEWTSKMETLAESVEERILKLLMSLAKVEKDNGSGDRYKDLYRQALTFKMKANAATEGSKLKNSYSLFSAIKEAHSQSTRVHG
jgi:tetratricopeptide (TPR) repeat protein